MVSKLLKCLTNYFIWLKERRFASIFQRPNFEVSGNPTIGLSGIPILSQFPLEFYYYRETGIKDYQDNFEKKVRPTLELRRLRVGKTNHIITQLCQQCLLKKCQGSKSP
jgi:hypothetical protein